MFKISPDPVVVAWPIKVKFPDSPNTFAEKAITVSFRFPAKYVGLTVADAIVGWEGIADAEGNALPCNPENIKVALDNLWLNNAISKGFFEVVGGKYLEKN